MRSGPLSWPIDGADWPHRAASRFVPAAGLMWHVQQLGQGPVLLLLHGTGASTHSWRGLLPLLGAHFTIVALDLPGHGFTGLPRAAQLSMSAMSKQLGLLLHALDLTPDYVVGHSAGAALAVRMTLDRRIAPLSILSLNGALLAPPGFGGGMFPLAARLAGGLPLVPSLLARTANDAQVERLLASTGSTIDTEGRRLYGRLFRTPSHVAAAFGMMGHWQLAALEADLDRLRTPLTLVAGEKDGMIPPAAAVTAQRLVPHATLVRMPGLGHLAHEEAPGAIADLIRALLPT